MRWFLQCLGAWALSAWLLGALNIIDFHVCIEAPGQCQIGKKAKP